LSKVKAKKISIQSLIIILGVLFGVLISAQWQSIPDRVTNPVVPYISLKDTKEELYREQAELKDSIKSLQSAIETAQAETKNISLSEDELRQLNQKKAEAGLTQIQGPGVIITLNDAKTSQINEDSIVHASDLRDVVNSLWSNGAEAISINDQRVVLGTAIDCIVNTVLINNVRISTPFVVRATGNKDAMFASISGMQNLIKRSKNNGLIFDISAVNTVIVPSFDGSFEVKAKNDV